MRKRQDGLLRATQPVRPESQTPSLAQFSSQSTSPLPWMPQKPAGLRAAVATSKLLINEAEWNLMGWEWRLDTWWGWEMDAHTGSSEPTCNRSLARREALRADHTTTSREGRARPCRECQRMSSEPGLGHRPSCFTSGLMLWTGTRYKVCSQGSRKYNRYSRKLILALCPYL